MVVALVALFVALGGSAVALKGRNSVKSDDIAPNAVRSADIRAKNVKTGDIADGAVTPAKLASQPSVVSVLHVDGGPVDTTDTPTEVPLTGNTWSQGANETDIIVGELRFDSPPPADCPFGAEGLHVTIAEANDPQFIVRNQLLFTAGANFRISLPHEKLDKGSAPPGDFDSSAFPVLPRPGTNTPRELILRIHDSCGTSNHYHLDSVKFDVLRFG